MGILRLMFLWFGKPWISVQRSDVSESADGKGRFGPSACDRSVVSPASETYDLPDTITKIHSKSKTLERFYAKKYKHHNEILTELKTNVDQISNGTEVNIGALLLRYKELLVRYKHELQTRRDRVACLDFLRLVPIGHHAEL